MIGLTEIIPSAFKYNSIKYKFVIVETKTYFGRTKQIYYIESEFCRIGPFDDLKEAAFWKVNLEKEPIE